MKTICFIVLCAALFWSKLANSQLFNFQQISIHEGLPQSQAFDVFFDTTDHVWIGTQGGGLCRFDGSNFLYFTKRDSLISDRIFKVQQSGDCVLIGQKGGVSKFTLGGRFIENYRFKNPATICQDIFVEDTEILVAANNGLYELKNNQLLLSEQNPSLNDLNIYRFFKGDNQLWCCSNKGLFNLKDPLKKLNKARGLAYDQVQCASTFDGKWLIGTYGGGLEVYDPIQKKLLANPFPELSELIILDIYPSSGGEVWIGTLNHGVFVYNKESQELKNFKTQNGLPNNHVKKITADAWGNIWIGTSGGGVAIFQNSPFVAYDMNVGLNGNYVFAVVNAANNQLWCSTEGGGVVRLNDTSSVLFDEEYGFVSEKSKAIFEDAQGDIWIGTEGEGIGVFSQYDGMDTIYRFNAQNGLPSNWVKCFAQGEGRNGKMYVGTYGAGIVMVDKPYDFPLNAGFLKVDGVPDRISDLKVSESAIWFTSPSGEFGFFKKDQLRIFQEESNVFRNIVVEGSHVWMGSADNGVLQLELSNDSILSKTWLNTETGLSSNNIYQLEMIQNILWVGSERGLDKVELDSVFGVQDITHFGVQEGFEGGETNINAAFVDREQKLWSGTVDGLFVHQGGQIPAGKRTEPRLFIEDFSIFYESIEKTQYADFYDQGKMVGDLLLPYDQNHIGFSFKAIHYTYASNIEYRWMLEGADRDWTPPTKNTTATYSNLTPGQYGFKLQASTDGEWNGETLSLGFAIDQPYYEKFWFKALYFSVIGFVLILIVLIIVFRLKRKNRALREKLEIEKNLIELEQKALRLQMNPHFIFNVLTSIHNLIILNDSDKARYALAKFSKLMRRVLENSREKFISIDDEIETLENYVQLEKLTANLDVELIVEMDEEIDSAEELLPPLMIQPFVENAIIHGLKELDYPGQIKVGFKLLNDHLLECFIEDNGRGRAKAATINAQKENYHKSTALQVTQERLSNLNKKSDFLPFEIIDLKDEQGKPCGTRVIFRLEI